MRRLLPFLALLALLAGCGGASNDSASDFEGAQKDVAEAIEDLEEAATEDEPARICKVLLAKAVVARIGSDCEKTVATAIDETDFFKLTVESVDVKGATATAKVETGTDEEKIEEIVLVKEANAWRVSELPGSS